MGKAMLLAATAALALAGCDKAEDRAPAPVPSAATPVAAAADSAAKSACAPAPTLALAKDFADPQEKFAREGEAFKSLQANFAIAYRKACDDGLLKDPLIPVTSPHPDTLFLYNAPDANDVAIYPAPSEDNRPGDTLLEYRFITTDGQVNVPSADDLHEAIYCSTEEMLEKDDDASGRCLVD